MNPQTLLDCIKNTPGSVMSPAYLDLWNAGVQRQIDEDIERHRKADAIIALEDCPPGTEVHIEQLSHQFVFGAHIFNYDQLGSDEANARYKELYGALFNSATIAFYWQRFEMEKDRPRFAGEYRDTAAFWNAVENPKEQPHWRRPATDPVVDFCERKGIRLHGHTLVWGNRRWHTPTWIHDSLPAEYRAQIQPERTLDNTHIKSTPSHDSLGMFTSLTPAQIEALLPEYTAEQNTLMAKRIFEIALHYKGRIHSWDVVNESAVDFEKGVMIPGGGLCKSAYGLMPGDYAHRAFKIAESAFPESVQLNINDYKLDEAYLRQVQALRKQACKIDILGAQMHLFDPQTCLDIADGRTDLLAPSKVRETMEKLAQSGLPIHLSEITITSPGDDERGRRIQAIIARNLYRLWFSIRPMMGITWWNVVDDCGAPGEPSVSGLFHRDMTPKASFYALDELINREWKTRLTASADPNSQVRFRGFRGTYRLSWETSPGRQQSRLFTLL